MDRRTKSRLDVELTCYVCAARVVARPFKLVTKNVSRNGMLMRWNIAQPVPTVGKRLTVDLELPENSDFGPRLMQCRATVVRIDRQQGNEQAVALRIHSMKFIENLKPADFSSDFQGRDLAKMPILSTRRM